MPALPRTYFDSPAPAVDMTGWSEERKRFFMLNGYDRGPATPETTVKVTETPPDDPTPTTRVTTTKYPEGMEEGGPIVSEPMLTAPGTFEGSRRSPPVPAGMLDTGEGVVEQSPETLFGSQDLYATAGAPEEEIFDAREALAGLVSGDDQVLFLDDDGIEVTMNDILERQLGAGRFGPGLAFLKRLPPQLRIKALKDWWKGSKKVETKKPQQPPGRGDIPGWSAYTRQLDRARAQEKLLRNVETAAAIGTGVAGGTAVGLLGQPEEEPPYYGYSPVLEEGRGAPAEESGTTTEQIVGDYEGLLVGQEDDSGIPITAQTGFITKSEVGNVAGEDDTEKQEVLDRFYDYFPEDIDAKRDRYLKGLKEIYKKVAILNVIAALTNSPSQAGAFMQMAAEKFKALEGFRGEERLQKIARGVFFTEDGQFDAPQSKQDAFNRAIRFGASHEEALALSGHRKEYAPTTTALPGYVTWNRTDPETGQMIEESFRKGVHPRDLGYGEGWSVGQGRAPDDPAWYDSMQRIETTLRTKGREAAINDLIWYWGSDPWFRMVFGEELEAQAQAHVDSIIAGSVPPNPAGEGGGQPTNIRRG